MKASFRMLGTAAGLLVAFTVVLGLLYPAAVFGVGRLMPHHQADGQPIVDARGVVRGSALIAQPVTEPGFFFPRPSAAGEHGYDPMSSSASHRSTAGKDYQAEFAARRAEIAQREQVPAAAVPVDAVTASGSGLDPHISVAYAQIQKARVARERGMSEEEVQRLIDENMSTSFTGAQQSKVVNVVTLNAALAGS